MEAEIEASEPVRWPRATAAGGDKGSAGEWSGEGGESERTCPGVHGAGRDVLRPLSRGGPRHGATHTRGGLLRDGRGKGLLGGTRLHPASLLLVGRRGLEEGEVEGRRPTPLPLSPLIFAGEMADWSTSLSALDTLLHRVDSLPTPPSTSHLETAFAQFAQLSTLNTP